jgi:hypothetical protein
VLTVEAPKLYQSSSGSTSAAKHIPFTPEYFSEIQMATAVWISSIYKKVPSLLGSRSYWSISPKADQDEGLKDDSEYLGKWGSLINKYLFVSSPKLSNIRCMEEWRKESIYCLLAAKDLGFISIWSPSFLLALIKVIPEYFEKTKDKYTVHRRSELESIFSQSKIDYREVWPQLKLISSWAEGESAPYLNELKNLFPGVLFESKGLAATEGIISFPYYKTDANILSYTSHFYEFIDLENPTCTPFMAHELEIGKEYTPLITNSGGLYRYHLKDRVKCVGHYRQIPLLEFKGKLDKVSDLAGEKISSGFAAECILALKNKFPALEFCLLTPDRSSKSAKYVLYIESRVSLDLSVVKESMEALLLLNPHYKLCRELKQLGNLEIQEIKEGESIYHRYHQTKGKKLGDIKAPVLELSNEIHSVFKGEYVS